MSASNNIERVSRNQGVYGTEPTTFVEFSETRRGLEISPVSVSERQEMNEIA